MKQHKIGARILAALLPMVCAAGFALPAAADLPAVLQNAAVLTAKSSYHFTMTLTMGAQTMKSEGDIQLAAPMKMRMTSSGTPAGPIEMIVVAPNSYMKLGSAPWKKYPGNPSDFSQMDINSLIKKDQADYTVSDIGMQMKDGQMLHGYKMLNKKRNSTQTLYLDSAGRMSRFDSDTMVMTLSNFGEPISITAPM
jgi:outer membrane lipoprotein-sorting protein